MSNPLVPDKKAAERRNSARVSFDAQLCVSDHWDENNPADESFRRVKAVDLSQTGISFRTTDWPSRDMLLIRLNERDEPTHVTARVIDSVRKTSESGDSCFEVRCEFVDWL